MINIVCSGSPFLPRKGDELIVYNHIKALSNVYKTKLYLNVAPWTKIRDSDIEGLLEYCEVEVFERSYIDIFLGFIYCIFNYMPLHFALFYNAALKKRLISTDQLTLVYLSRNYVNIPKVKRSRCMVHFIDSMTLNFHQRSLVSNYIFSLIYKAEMKLNQIFENKVLDQIILGFVVAEHDLKFFDENMKNIKVLPNGVDIKRHSSIEKEYDIVFSGNLDYQLNIDAIKNLIWINQLLRKHNVICRILLVGKCTNDYVLGLSRLHDNITVTGEVHDIHKMICKARLAVIPMYRLSGMQNKVLEAIAAQVPVLTTPVVAKSFCKELQDCIYISSNNVEFAKKIEMLIGNDTRLNGKAAEALEVIERHYNWDKIIDAIELQNKL